MKTKVFTLYALSVLSIGFWFYAGSLFSFVEPFWSLVLLLPAWLLFSSLLLVAMRLAHSRWVFANLFALAAVPLLPNLLVRVFSESFVFPWLRAVFAGLSAHRAGYPVLIYRFDLENTVGCEPGR